MTDQNPKKEWGLCVDCQNWQIELNAIATHQTAGLCLAAALRPFRLRVTGNSGCQEFHRGPTARGAGSNLKPPPIPGNVPPSGPPAAT
ncbi:hypothetical protein Pan44_40180 [Caulifigura coniformis]|uniref:Uncharacterized protein n=1 Tax=Caulifigura coniformis TaxID=2527983 RepID=A0A517SIN8_9PLAN|nr:hypothetical protein Pan44_40180 [Caulifigura coniformis]